MRRAAALLIALVTVAGATVGCAKAKGSKEAFCKELRETPALSAALAGYPTGDQDSYVEQLREAREAFGDLQKSAPRSIRADVGMLGELVDDIVETIEDNPGDPLAVATQLRMEMLSNASRGKAALKVSTYASEECGLDLGGVGAVPPDGFEPSSSIPGVTVTTPGD